MMLPLRWSRMRAALVRLLPPAIRGRAAPTIFISYRRKSSASGYALALYDRLNHLMGDSRVFFDVAKDAIEVGDDWRVRVAAAVRGCGYLVVFIDENWASRLSDPDDPVRFELEQSLEAHVTIVPVRVGAVMPARGAFPERLRHLADVNAAAIRSESAASDLEALIGRLLPGVPLRESYLDGTDYTLAGGVLAVGFLVWLSWGRSAFNTTELWLWGSALILSTALALLVRRLLRWSRAALPGWRAAMPWVSAFVPLLSVWTYAAVQVYRVPVFPADASGILVARFRGDPGDLYQARLVKSLDSVIAEKRLGERHRLVRALPRRISSRICARRLGSRAGAVAVLWGEASAVGSASSSAVEAKLTFVQAAGFFEPRDSPISGAEGLSSGPREVSVHSPLGTLLYVLPLMLQGYRVYHSADGTLDYSRAGAYFDSTLTRLAAAESADRSGSLQDLRATVLFYLGNIHYVMAHATRAEESYQEAIKYSMNPIEQAMKPDYIEPVNNLGHLLLEQQRYGDAVAVLRRADLQCGEDTTIVVCAYAFYNLGTGLLELGDYEGALSAFRSAAARIAMAERAGALVGTPVYRLAAYARQNMAYTEVKLAALTNDVRWLEMAERDGELGAQLLKEHLREEVPKRFRITRARILIERREWDRAYDLLSSLRGEGITDPSLFALLAGVQWCVGDHVAFIASLQRLGSVTMNDTAARRKGMDDHKSVLRLCDTPEGGPPS